MYPALADGAVWADNASVRWRWITWLILLFSGAMLLWASTRVGSPLDCAQHPAGSAARDACELQRDIRSGIGLFAVGVVWIGGTLVLAVIWLGTRPRKRSCPRCGRNVKVGLTACPACGRELDAAAAGDGATP
jgi:hypothetical protein